MQAFIYECSIRQVVALRCCCCILRYLPCRYSSLGVLACFDVLVSSPHHFEYCVNISAILTQSSIPSKVGDFSSYTSMSSAYSQFTHLCSVSLFLVLPNAYMRSSFHSILALSCLSFLFLFLAYRSCFRQNQLSVLSLSLSRPHITLSHSIAFLSRFFTSPFSVHFLHSHCLLLSLSAFTCTAARFLFTMFGQSLFPLSLTSLCSLCSALLNSLFPVFFTGIAFFFSRYVPFFPLFSLLVRSSQCFSTSSCSLCTSPLPAACFTFFLCLRVVFLLVW